MHDHLSLGTENESRVFSFFLYGTTDTDVNYVPGMVTDLSWVTTDVLKGFGLEGLDQIIVRNGVRVVCRTQFVSVSPFESMHLLLCRWLPLAEWDNGWCGLASTK